MIVVTRLNDSQFAINPDLIERIHETPRHHPRDGGRREVHRDETMAEVIDLVARYRSRIVALAYDELAQLSPPGQPCPPGSGRTAELRTRPPASLPFDRSGGR